MTFDFDLRFYFKLFPNLLNKGVSVGYVYVYVLVYTIWLNTILYYMVYEDTNVYNDMGTTT